MITLQNLDHGHSIKETNEVEEQSPLKISTRARFMAKRKTSSKKQIVVKRVGMVQGKERYSSRKHNQSKSKEPSVENERPLPIVLQKLNVRRVKKRIMRDQSLRHPLQTFDASQKPCSPMRIGWIKRVYNPEQ